jgi:uridine monophosphate synthetase
MTFPYAMQCVDLARLNRDFVVGFIAQGALNREPDDVFLVLTPGVKLPPQETESSEETEGGRKENEGDGWGQRYRTPREAILVDGADVIIVGRGILDSDDSGWEAERYRTEGWRAYEERVGLVGKGKGV